MASNVAWTKEEDDYLRENCNKMSIDVIAKALGRTESAVQKRGSVLGLKFVRRNAWSVWEKELLFSEMSYEEIADATGRTLNSVKSAAYREGAVKRVKKKYEKRKKADDLGVRVKYRYTNEKGHRHTRTIERLNTKNKDTAMARIIDTATNMMHWKDIEFLEVEEL